MADNIQAGAAVGSGPIFATALGTWSGDSANFPGCFIALASGSEGSWTFTSLAGGSGVVSAGTVRVVLATDVALPAGTNAIGKLAANSGVIIGAVEQSGSWSVTVSGTVTVGSHAVTNAGTFAVQESGGALTSLQLIDDAVFAEDAGHSSGDKGFQMLAVRNDSDASLCGTSLDYTPLQVDSNGYLKVNIKAGAGSGGTASTDDAAFTAASGSGTPMMGFVTADSVDSGDVGVVGMLANRQLKVTLYDSGGSELSVGGGTQYDEDTASANAQKVNMAGVTRADTAASQCDTDGDRTTLIVDSTGRLHVNVGNTVTVGSHAVTNAGTFAVQATLAAGATTVAKAEDAAHSSGDVGVFALAVRQDTATQLAGTDGDYSPLITDANGRLHAIVAIAASQTLATVTTVTTVTTCSTVTTLTQGGIAHDSADSGNPHKIGGRATTALHSETMVANADRSDMLTGADGVQLIRPHTNLESIVSGNASNTDGASTECIAAAGAGVKQYLTSVVLTNTSSSNIYVEIKSGTTVKATIPLPANGGAIFNPPVPLPPNAANEAWNFDPSAAASTVYCSMIGFKSKL